MSQATSDPRAEERLAPGVQLTGLGRSKEGIPVALIATMPKSGTWYSKYFIHFYTSLLLGEDGYANRLDIVKNFCCEEGRKLVRTLGINELSVCHTTCPGFESLLGDYKESWEKLQFYTSGLNHGRSYLDEHSYLYNPARNEEVKIAYLVRNPLDQSLSAYRHIVNHKDPLHRTYTDVNGQQNIIFDVRTYLFSVGLETYVKQYLTFKLVKAAYPDNVKIFHYEDLVRDPEKTFKSVLEFFGHNVLTDGNEAFFEQALKLSSKDSISKIENELGRALANDQADPNERHIRDGMPGRWKEFFTPEDVLAAQERLNKFGIDLSEFTLE